MGHKANLDILRSFAVTAVLIDHFVPTLKVHVGIHSHTLLRYTATIGHAGVLAFFVHTSLVLMYSLERMNHTQEHVTWKFYVRRFFRIYPLSIFAILLALTFHIPSLAWRTPDPVTPAVVISNLLLVQNLFVRQDILMPLWSLPYEVQMYLVLPGLYLIASKRKAVAYLGSLILLFSLIGLLLSYRTGHLNLIAYVPCFLSGVLCYALRQRIKPFLPAFLWPPFLMVMIYLFLLTNRQVQPIYWISWIYCLILGLSINAFKDSTFRPGNWAANKLATYSYGMYLLHVPVLYLLFMRLQIKSFVAGPVLFFALTLLASIVTYHVLEHPAIKLGLRLSSKAKPMPVAAEKSLASSA